MEERAKGNYGIDGPLAWPVLLLLVAVLIGAGAILHVFWLWAVASVIAVCTGTGLHASLRGKFSAWTRLFNEFHFRGDEQILDLGCGRGAILLLAARRLTTGRAVGVDLWRKRDQSGNAEQATADNAVREGVADRVELHTGDMAALPFENERFDLVTSNMAIHNISGRAARDRAIDEAVRVLRPGGRLLISDIKNTKRYRVRLVELGMKDVARKSLGPGMWWCGPILRTFVVSATKPCPLG